MTRRRLLAGLLVCLALACGLWRNSTRLNETERKLVGVWEVAAPGDSTAMVLLADGRYVPIARNNRETSWTRYSPDFHWKASPQAFVIDYRPPIPGSASYSEWRTFYEIRWTRRWDQASRLLGVTDNEFQLSHQGKPTIQLHRSIDPELLRMFEKLSAGESP